MKDARTEMAHVLKNLDQLMPGLWQELYPRRTIAPREFWSPEGPPLKMALALLEYEHRTFDSPRETEGNALLRIIAAVARRWKMPAYWIKDSLAEALWRSKAPNGLRFEDISMPFPAWTLHVPKGLLVDPDGEEITFVSCGRIPSEVPRIPGLKSVSNVKAPMFVGVAGNGAHDGSVWHWYYPMDLAVSTVIPEGTLEGLAGDLDHSRLPRGQLEPSQNAFLNQLKNFTIIVNLVLSNSGFVEQYVGAFDDPMLMQLDRPAKNKGGRLREALYRPRVIGEKYLLKTRAHRIGMPSPTAATSRETKMPHWVCGHVRMQPYGPQGTLRKPVWIEPYQTGGATDPFGR